jgi:Spy/CpxP family protein refolding chaperone
MKKISLLNILFTVLMLAFAFLNANAQVEPPPNGGNEFTPPQKRPNLLQELGLSKAQIQQIRRINTERRPTMQAAKKRLDDANFALDEAIYGDNFSESDIQARLKEVQMAHAEVLKNRTFNETAIRNVLTPDQLVRFRQLRREFNPQNRQIKNQERQNGEIINQNRPNIDKQQNPNRLKILQRRKILQQQRPN